MRYIPNALSASRILVSFITIPFLFQWLGNEFEFFGRHVLSLHIALVLCVYAGLSDFLDGFIARKFGYTSDGGANLDQWADKIWSWPIIGSLWILAAIPWWLVAIVACRDISVVLLRWRLKKTGTALNVSFLGKLKAALLFVYICASVLVLMGDFSLDVHLMFSVLVACMVGGSGI
ncbi:MAG: CDP-alcohol phosphatidyltransferase family protein, partial [Parcubacteria group bacterium]|nr:CDP-alcohol phosphatidyltransferase family protein [Parcubacteria group bacterium]